jgi:DNA polymerase-3 subunit delta
VRKAQLSVRRRERAAERAGFPLAEDAVPLEGAKELADELALIHKGKGKPAYLIFGAESYLVRTAAQALTEALAASSSAEIVPMDTGEKSAAELLQSLLSLSLFASARVIVGRNFMHLLAGEEADELLQGLQAISPGSALVLVAQQGEGAAESRIDKRVRGFKGIGKLGAILEFPIQKAETLALWLVEEAAKDGKKLTPAAANLILARVGNDMELLRAELEKALLYCMERTTIDATDLTLLVGRSHEEAVWEIADAVMRRDARRAVMLIEDQLAVGVHPLVLMTLLIRQARHLLQARLLWEEAGRPEIRDYRRFQMRFSGAHAGRFGKGADDVTAIHPFASFKRFEAARRHDAAPLRRMLSRLRRADRDAKSGGGAGAREVLEETVLDLCALAREVA